MGRSDLQSPLYMTSDNIMVTVAVPDWADDDFFTALLRSDVGDAGLTLESCVLNGTTTVGDNYMSVLLRASIEYRLPGDKEATKLKLIIKSLPTGEMMQKWIEQISAFDHELHMYTVTLPQLHALAKGLDWKPLAPRMLVTDLPNTVVVEDLTPHGFKMANRRQGLDLAHSTLALGTLARMHATSLVLYEQQPETMDYFKEIFFVEENRKMLAEFMETTFDSLAREVGTWEGFERFEATVKKVSSTSVDRCIEMFKHRPGSLRVLNHGDFWTNNMLFRYDADGHPVDHRMIDFQLGRFASPAFDLYYFLCTSPREDVFESSLDFLIEEYHKVLSSALCDLGSETSITLDQIQEELADKEYYSVIMSCMFSMMIADPTDAPDLASFTEDNLDTVGAEAMGKAFSGERFRIRFQRRLIKFEQLGLI